MIVAATNLVKLARLDPHAHPPPVLLSNVPLRRVLIVFGNPRASFVDSDNIVGAVDVSEQ